ncbi:DNA-J related domain-containing protein [Rhabdochromatium marinum]|uniref:DNA-J related domain-containing protein n=1 Tax=Rhabdochromatium marinum TaxID=48729 RepID=UPI0019075E90|nr:DNA-J related domain-containing protein [Rhabdochromatium marinum]MBK1647834.1 hypothetical protein [Rhabdochromatium marinum]
MTDPRPGTDPPPQALTHDVLQRLFEILTRHPAGLSEYELLRELEGDAQTAFAQAPFRNDLALFQAHFLLFNALYRLRDQLAATGQAWLDIDVLRIVLRFHNEAGSARPGALARPDPLRAYYLDIHQLAQTDAEQLAEWLGDFWMHYFAQEGRTAALAELGLSDPVNAQQIRRRYRELAMQHHPDRGGDIEAFRRLQSARQVLERCGSHKV